MEAADCFRGKNKDTVELNNGNRKWRLRVLNTLESDQNAIVLEVFERGEWNIVQSFISP